MGTRGGTALGPWLVFLALLPLGACSCDDKLIDMSFEIPEVEDPRVPRTPPLPPTGRLELGFDAVITSASGCDGEPLQLKAQAVGGRGPHRYRWDPHPDLSDVDSPSPVVTGYGTREFFVTVTDAEGREVRVGTTVRRSGLPVPAIAFAAGGNTTCVGTEVILDGSGSRSADGSPVAALSWDLDGDGVPDAAGPESGAFLPVDGQAVRLTAYDATGCSASTELSLAVRESPRPVVDFLAGGPRICPGTAVALDGSRSEDAQGKPLSDFTWDLDGDGAADATGPATGSFTPTASGEVRLTVGDRYGCTATATVRLDLNPVPVADAGPDRQVALGGAVRLSGMASGGTPGYTYRWSPAATLDDSRIASPRASPRASTTYLLEVVDAAGCSGSDQVNVSVVDAIAVDAGPDRRLCLDGGRGVSLAATVSGGVPPLSYQWTANPPCGGCIANPASPITAVSPTVPTVFTLTVADANGTTAADTVAVAVFTAGFPVDAGPDRRIERGQVTQLGTPALPGLEYRWTCDNWSCGLSDTQVAMPLAAPEGNTAYKVTVTDNETCTGTDTVIVSMDSRVIATVPTEGYTPWPRDALVWVVFDADMDPATLHAGNIRLLDPSDGDSIQFASISYDAASRTLTLDPVDRQYWNNRPVVLVLAGGPGGIRTAAPYGSHLATDFALEYNASSNGDGRAPGIAYSQPAPFAVGVATSTDVVVRFDEPVDPRSVTPATFQIVGVPATVTYDPRTYTANLRTDSPLAPATAYTVRIAGVKDGPGNAALVTWTFTTGAGPDTAPPTVVGSSPYPGEAAFDVAGTVSVTFSEPVDPETLDGLRLLDVATGFPVSGEILYDEATRTAVLDPHRILEPNHAYRVEVEGVADQAGNELVGTFAAAFTTQPVHWLERFESGTGGWNLTGGWATHFQAARYGLLGLTDSPTGDTPANVDWAAVAPAFNVAGKTSVSLSFWNRRTMATTGTDQAIVEFSTNGNNWAQAPGGSVLTGPIGWRLQTYQLPTGGANQLRLRFRIRTDAAVNLDGWFLDELVVR
jgi:hypothetical protein